MDVLKDRQVRRNRVERLEDAPVARALFGDVRWAWLWLILRVYLGWEWLSHRIDKLSNPAWIGPNAGAAVSGFVQGALAQSTGERPNVQDWYASFLENIVLPNAAVWSYLVTIGEILVGVALILGIFTGIAAFFWGVYECQLSSCRHSWRQPGFICDCPSACACLEDSRLVGAGQVGFACIRHALEPWLDLRAQR